MKKWIPGLIIVVGFAAGAVALVARAHDAALTPSESFVGVAADQADCVDDELPWVRLPGLVTCASPCVSDEDCPGYLDGSERCRLLDPYAELGAADVFVDTETAAALADDVAAEVTELAAVADSATDSEKGEEAAAETMLVDVQCDSDCSPIEVTKPHPAEIVRLCDALWDADVATFLPEGALDEAERD